MDDVNTLSVQDVTQLERQFCEKFYELQSNTVNNIRLAILINTRSSLNPLRPACTCTCSSIELRNNINKRGGLDIAEYIDI